MVYIATGLSVNEARVMEQIIISAYTKDCLLNARREISVGNIKGFVENIRNVCHLIEGVTEDELLN